MNNVTTPPRIARRGKPKGRHPDKRLSAAFVRSAPPGRHCDGNGLYLYVQRTGTRSWIQRLVVRGRKRELGLGSVALVSLAEAREQALANRKLARTGGDPMAEKRRSVGIPTFAEAARRVVEQEAGRVAQRGRVPRNWHRSFEIHVFPRIGRVPVSEVTSADVLEILIPIWHAKPPTARIVRHPHPRGAGMGHRHGLENGQPVATGSCRCSAPSTMPSGTGRPCPTARWGRPSGRCGRRTRARWDALAFEFLVLTAARGVEVRGAAWSEIDREERVWTVPREPDEDRPRAPGAALRAGPGDSRSGPEAGRRRESDRVRRQSAAERWAASRWGRLLGKHRITAVPHGFRSSFRDWARRRDGPPPGRSSRRLWPMWSATPVEAAYMRSDLFERRRRLMDDWEAYLVGEHRDPEGHN